jgi:hypothetical protein
MHPGNKEGEKPPSPKSLKRPQKCCGILEHRHGTLRHFYSKQHFIVLSQTQKTCVQRLSPASRLQKQEARFNPYMVTCNSVAYFNPQCYVTFFTFRLFKYFLPSMPLPPPCYFIITQNCSFLFCSPPRYTSCLLSIPQPN